MSLETSFPELRVCLVQIKLRDSYEKILANIERLVRQAVVEHKPRVVALPECINGPYEETLFHEFAEVVPSGPTSQLMSRLAKELNIYILGGIIERNATDPKLMYNACIVFDPDGKLIARHRKTHLCDVLLGGQRFAEANYLVPGNGITTFLVDGIKCGAAICYDASFVGFIHLYKQAGMRLSYSMEKDS